MFVDELVAAYPEAKVILTNRDVDDWLTSMNNTFYIVLNWWSMKFLAKVDGVRLFKVPNLTRYADNSSLF